MDSRRKSSVTFRGPPLSGKAPPIDVEELGRRDRSTLDGKRGNISGKGDALADVLSTLTLSSSSRGDTDRRGSSLMRQRSSQQLSRSESTLDTLALAVSGRVNAGPPVLERSPLQYFDIKDTLDGKSTPSTARRTSVVSFGHGKSLKPLGGHLPLTPNDASPNTARSRSGSGSVPPPLTSGRGPLSPVTPPSAASTSSKRSSLVPISEQLDKSPSLTTTSGGGNKSPLLVGTNKRGSVVVVAATASSRRTSTVTAPAATDPTTAAQSSNSSSGGDKSSRRSSTLLSPPTGTSDGTTSRRASTIRTERSYSLYGLDVDVAPVKYKADPAFTTSDPYQRRNVQVFLDQNDMELLNYSRSMLRTPPEVVARMRAAAKRRAQKQHPRRARPQEQAGTEDDLDEADAIPEFDVGSPKIHSVAQSRRDRAHSSFMHSPSMVTAREAAVSSVDRPIAADGDAEGNEDEEEGAEEEEEDPFRGQRYKYFGLDARLEFSDMFRDAQKDLTLYPEVEDMPDDRKTPRMLYLRHVVTHNLLPLQLLIRKETAPYEVNLKNRGLGDDRAAPVIEVLDMMPAIQSINLCDNRLTDDTLMALALKLPHFESLTFLDLSYNKMDDSSETIIEYLESDECKLQTLLLNGADVDDGEAANLMEAFKSNKSVHTLGLAHNKVGTNEVLKTVKPDDVVTGGEAIAAMLMVNTTLTKLDVSWNGIRQWSAMALGMAFENNSTLKSLNLAYNAFGDMGTQVLGRALRKNTVLEEINLTSNSVMPKAAAVLAHSLCYNETLQTLILDGNVLGKVGTQALVAKMQRAVGNTKRLRVSFQNCDTNKDVQNLFNPATPGGVYTVDLAEPYGQMVIETAFFLGNFRAGCGVNKLVYENEVVELVRQEKKGERKWEPKKYRKACVACAKQLQNKTTASLRRSTEPLLEILGMFELTMEKEFALLVLDKVKERWNSADHGERTEELHEVILFEIFAALFDVIDEERTGTIDVKTFLRCLESLGKTEVSLEHAMLMMEECDIDGTGSINAEEFSMIMVNQMCKTDEPKGHIVEKYSKMAWRIPRNGKCTVDVQYEYEIPSRFNVGNDAGLLEVLDNMKDAGTDEERDAIFKQATQSPYFFFTASQAQVFYNTCVDEIKMEKTQAVASILPQVVNAEEAVKFLDHNLDEEEKLVLRVRLGTVYGICTGVYTGHYCWDLKNEEHVRAGQALSAVATAETRMCKQAGTNLSQTGDFSTYRNGRLGSLYVPMTANWFNKCPSSGTVHMDYVSACRPVPGTKPLNDVRFQKLLGKIGFDDIPAEWIRLTNSDFQKVRAGRRRREAEEAAAKARALRSPTTAGTAGRRTSTATSKRTGTAATEENRRLSSAMPVPGGGPTGVGSLPASPDGSRPNSRGSSPSGARSRSPSPSRAASRAGSPTTIAASPQPGPGPGISRKGSGWGMLKSSILKSNAIAALDEGEPDVSRRGSVATRGRSPTSSLGSDSAPASPEPPTSGNKLRGTTAGAIASTLVRRMSTHRRAAFTRPDPQPIVKPLTSMLCKEYHVEYIDTCHHFFDMLPVEKQKDFSRAGYLGNLADGERPPTPDRLKRGPPPLRFHHDIFPFCFRRLLLLQVQLPSVYLSVRQVLEIIDLLPEVDYLRVMTLQALYSRIVDLESFHLVLDALVEDERDELYHRLGFLNVCDPMHPDRLYKLDLRRWEHREWCKVLIQLTINEPGESWGDVTYSWSRYDEPVPGWELPAPWAQPDDEPDPNTGVRQGDSGPRRYGWLVVTYRSSGYGCQPNLISRKNLRKRCLVGLKKIV